MTIVITNPRNTAWTAASYTGPSVRDPPRNHAAPAMPSQPYAIRRQMPTYRGSPEERDVARATS